MSLECTIEIPAKVGAMTLPGTTLFPGSLLPLYIFEPRYRLMLSRALEAERIFAVTSRDPVSGRPESVGGVGLIRACVQNEDGTSHLVLQGISRVEFTSWEQQEPYHIGTVRRLVSIPARPEDALDLMQEIRSLCQQLAAGTQHFPEKFNTYLQAIEDPDVFSDVLAATLIADAGTRQELLEELDAMTRLLTLRRSLRVMMVA